MEVGRVLEPEGFIPQKGRRVWRREQGGFLAEVSLQLSPKLDEVTVNFDLRHEAARARIHAVAGIGLSGGYFCLNHRIGELATGEGRWWARSNPDTVEQVANLLHSEVLPFFSRMQTLEPYIAELAKLYGRERWTLVTPRLELAVLLHDRGEAERALAMLDNPHPRFGARMCAEIRSMLRVLLAMRRFSMPLGRFWRCEGPHVQNHAGSTRGLLQPDQARPSPCVRPPDTTGRYPDRQNRSVRPQHGPMCPCPQPPGRLSPL